MCGTHHIHCSYDDVDSMLLWLLLTKIELCLVCGNRYPSAIHLIHLLEFTCFNTICSPILKNHTR